MKEPTLILTLDTGMRFHGERYTVSTPVEQIVHWGSVHVEPPGPTSLIIGGLRDVVAVLKRKEYRRDLFLAEARRMGALLADRMEDSEGWHGEHRVEPAKTALHRGD